MRQAPPNRRDQAGYHPCSDVTNLKHAHNLTQTEIGFKIEVMLNYLENISTTSLSPLNQLRITYSRTVDTSFTNVMFACNLIVVSTRRGQHSSQMFFATRVLYDRF